METVLVVRVFTEKTLRMKISLLNTQNEANFQWPILAKTQMEVNFSLHLLPVIGLMASTLSLEKLQKV